MLKAVAAAIALAATPFAATAAQVVLTPASVVGSSGYYSNCCSFAPGNIFDQQAGPVTETFGGGYWINPDNGPANAYLTIDLGGITSLGSLTFYNTHNGYAGDRGTGNFSIFGSNSVTGGQLDSPTLLLSATLAAASVAAPLAAQNFAVSGSYRYLSFNPTSVAAPTDGAFQPCCANVYGLNELRVLDAAPGAVPEPATWSLLLGGFALTGAAMRRRSEIARVSA